MFFFSTQEYLLFRLQSQPNTGPGCLYFFTRVPSICRTTLRKRSNKYGKLNFDSPVLKIDIKRCLDVIKQILFAQRSIFLSLTLCCMHASHQQDKQRTKNLSIVTNNQQIRSFSNKIAGCCPGNRWLDNNQRLPEIRLGPSRICPNNISHTHGQLPFWPCSSVGGAEGDPIRRSWVQIPPWSGFFSVLVWTQFQY